MTTLPRSSVDPTDEIAAIKARLDLLAVEDPTTHIIVGMCYEGVDMGTTLQLDGFGVKAPYRDLQTGSTIPAAGQRMLGAGEQSQPHIFAFQIEHVAKTRKLATDLAIETDRSLIGWSPTTNSSQIKQFFFTTYDEFAKNGERVQWIATRFYETTLGQNPDFNGIFDDVSGGGYGVEGYGL